MAAGLDDRHVGILEAVVERLIPGDAASPGAREAESVRYILRALDAEYRGHLADYVDGLGRLDAYAQASLGADFVALTPEQQAAVLADAEAGRISDAGPPLSAFFELVLQHTREGTFGDPAWGGNAGGVGWRMLGYPGPRFEWTAEDQRVEVIPSQRLP